MKFFSSASNEDQKPISLAEIVKRRFLKRKETLVGYGTEYQIPNRESQLNSLRTKKFDVLVIGGGAIGSGIAADAQFRGLSVALIEKDDFGSGTSGRTSKLLHGGIQYIWRALTYFDRQHLRLAQEALQERAICMRSAPHLTSALRVISPIYNYSDIPFYWVSGKLHDWLAGRENLLQKTKFVSPAKIFDIFPMIQFEKIVGGISFWEGQFNDTRYNVSLALTAATQGACVLNHTQVIGIRKSKDSMRVIGVTVRDSLTGQTFPVEAKTVVNATGNFADVIRRLDSADSVPLLQAQAGTHVILNKNYSAVKESSVGLYLPRTPDGRVVFLFPYNGVTIAGIRDSPCDTTIPYPKVGQKEISYILNQVNKYFHVQAEQSEVVAAWAGIRTLKSNGDFIENCLKNAPEYQIYSSPSGLITVLGGKWTTFRKMAEETVDVLIETHPHVLGYSNMFKPSHSTKNMTLIGGKEYSPDFVNILQNTFHLEEDIAKHLNDTYGDQSVYIAQLLRENGKDYSKRLVKGHPFIEAEVLYVVRKEYACTTLDVLARRFGLSFVDVNASLVALPRVIDILSNEFDWTPVRRQKEFTEAKNTLMIEGIPMKHKVSLPPSPPTTPGKKEETKKEEQTQAVATIEPQASVVL